MGTIATIFGFLLMMMFGLIIGALAWPWLDRMISNDAYIAGVNHGHEVAKAWYEGQLRRRRCKKSR